MLLTKMIYLLIPITGLTITEINMHEWAKFTQQASSGRWALLLKLAHFSEQRWQT